MSGTQSNVPTDWVPTTLGTDSDVLTGFPFASRGFVESGVRLLRGSNVKRGNIDWSETITKYWTATSKKLKQFELREGDLVIAMDGALVGRSFATISEADLPALLVQRVMRIRSSSIDRRLLSSWVSSDKFERHVDLVKTHTAIPHVSPRDIQGFTFVVPTKRDEQHAIGEALFSVNALLAALDRLIAKKRGLKQAAMQQLLTGRGRLPGFTSEWKVCKLGDVADIKTGPFGSSLHESDYVQSGTPIITVEHLGEFGIEHCNLPLVCDADRRRLQAYTLIPGDIVFSRVGSVDRNALVRSSENGWLFSGRLLRVRADSHKVHAPFLSFHFSNDVFKAMIRGVAVGQTMASLNTRILSGVYVTLPALPEQVEIAAFLNDMNQDIAFTELRRDKVASIKQAMMQELLTGKIRLV